MHRIGIRREDKNQWERRVPVTPEDVRLMEASSLEFVVQPSDRRIFADADYVDAGARVGEDLSQCGVILAVKEIPAELIHPGHTYVFFSHTIKGQPHGMPLLQRVLDSGATLIDYERIVDDQGRRLVAFGRHAGLAGAIDGLWALGRRWQAQGFVTPLLALKQAVSYADLETALDAVAAVGRRIAADGLSPELGPLVIGVTGYGKVGGGVMEVLDRLPTVTVAPKDLTEAYLEDAGTHAVHVAVFAENDTVRAKDGAAFDLTAYRARPGAFESTFADFLPLLSMLVNSVYWDEHAPRLVRIDDLADAARLAVIADLSCDIEGGIEATVTATDTGDPVFTFDPQEGTAHPGFEGPGVTILAVDNLPCELPRDASAAFSDALRPFLVDLATADYTVAFDDLDLPSELKTAVIAHRGELAPGYAHLTDALAEHPGE